jgi:hypothetical protein
MTRAVRLHELQTRFAASLAESGLEDERLAVYRNTIRANYRNALAATYPVTRALLGRALFDTVVDAYVSEYPSSSGDLNVYGGALADLLALRADCRELNYLSDVARLEWSIDEAGRAGDTPYRPQGVIEALAAVPSKELGQQRFVLDASCRFVHSSCPVYAIWRAHQLAYAGEGTPGSNDEASRILVRRTQEDVVVELVDPAEFAWLTALCEGAYLERAVETAVAVDGGFDLGRVLHTRVVDGTVVGLIPR